MSAVQPVAVYALRIPPGDVLIPAVPEFAAMFRVTMAAIDPFEETQPEDIDDKRKPRATLKVIRIADDMIDDDDSEEDEDYLDGLDIDEDDESSDEETNGGPSDKKSRKQRLLEALAAVDEDEEMGDDDDDDDDDDEIDAAAEIKKIIAVAKGKGKAIEGESDDDEDEDDLDSEEGIELDECVLCTLDPEKNYQQPLDFVVNEGEKIFFKVSGTHTVHLTGNYVMPLDDGQASLYDDEDDEEEEYDLSPDEDELALLEGELDDEDESDELDDIADPRITELNSDEDAKKVAQLKKGKNKRPAEESDDENGADLDAIMAKSIKKDATLTNGEPAKKLSKAEKKAAKKLKKNDGEAAATATPIAVISGSKAEAKKETSTPNSDKKVQFAKDIIQGPTPSATSPAKKGDKKEDRKSDKSAASTASLGVRDVQGVTVDDRKVGSGPQAKKGSRLEMRYVGKLENGKVFDSNKSGTPFKLKVGVGEVIKGWDIGLQGMSAGGERRLTIPAHLAYGSKALPGIPKNSKLIFDVKCLSVK